MRRFTAPIATYRLQLNGHFTFRDAAQIVPYLHRLGISHVYASPLLKARAGSSHGYDIVDHGSLNPELGTDADFLALTSALKRHGMKLIVDIVPNHMGVWSDDNPWWLDIMENGEASRYASYFDIDWHPADPTLKNKVLIPCLAEHYGDALESGKLHLCFNPSTGVLAVQYYRHLFPLDPRTYPNILTPIANAIASAREANEQDRLDLNVIVLTCRNLPRRTELSRPSRRRRESETLTCKSLLAQLYKRSPAIAHLLEAELHSCNGKPESPASFERLHHLLEAQAYRLAHWLVATDEINYRRFFDINDLAAIRMDQREVFVAAHRRIRHMLTHGQLAGIRIDHPDGLSDPRKYLHDLQALATAATPDRTPIKRSLYVIVEKILATDESLPQSWPVHGTTGYDAAEVINGLFVHPDSARSLERTYAHFIGKPAQFDDLLYSSKKLVMHTTLAGELTVLANIATGIARADRHNRDFTFLSLRDALTEIVAWFPVYRTYFDGAHCSESDHRFLHWAISAAKQHSRPKDLLIFDYLAELLSLHALERYSTRIRRQIVQLALRFQQYTAPVMAKALEDTTFYLYNRLLSLNEIGSDPRRFAISCDTFHEVNEQRLTRWPDSMICTSTHDSKRSEDVRCRINVLSELPDEWRRRVIRWRVLNRSKKRHSDEDPGPSANDEYYLYQTLVGTWPLQFNLDSTQSDYCKRVQDHMIRAVNGARMHSSWINRNSAYEQATRHFITEMLVGSSRHRFLGDFLPFQERISLFGMYNSLSQALLKLTIPGVPDIYQGNDLWVFRMTDPDNRQAIDYIRRHKFLNGFGNITPMKCKRAELLRELRTSVADGRLKLYLTWCALQLRHSRPLVFAQGDYRALSTDGTNGTHICAFARVREAERIVVAVSRWLALLTGGLPAKLDDPGLWQDTWVQCPLDPTPNTYHNVLDGQSVPTTVRDGKPWFNARRLFQHLPVALLSNCSELSP